MYFAPPNLKTWLRAWLPVRAISLHDELKFVESPGDVTSLHEVAQRLLKANPQWALMFVEEQKPRTNREICKWNIVFI